MSRAVDAIEEIALKLCELSNDEAEQDGIILLNGHRMLIALLEAAENHSKISEHVTQALISLSHMSLNHMRPGGKQLLLDAGVLPPTIALLRNGTERPPCLETWCP